ncbi:serine hydrolase domain-containing protein [Nocardia sp. NPDC058518]|uniref:serine hydrolase domain-containing protein n=1 Tax=Nocardia sp. NPDC058518 TaxID=3346534 RepID=UPI0036534AEE
MADIHGAYDLRFERVAQLLADNIDLGKEVGASLYLNIGGADVIDIWGGWKDREHSDAWAEDTIVNVFSGSKTVSSLAVLVLADRAGLDVDAPVADYWPEFAQHGKDKVLVRHLMSHTSGVSGWEEPFRFEDAFDIEASTSRLAAQSTWWEPGTASAYHASTYGHLIGELVRRVTGKTLREFIASEFAAPLDAAFQLGVAEADFGRIATIYPVEDGPAPEAAPEDLQTPAEIINAKTRAGSFAGTMGDPFTVFNSPQWWRTEFGGSSGHTNARGLGRIISALTNGGVSRGVDLLTPATIDLIFSEQANGIDMYYNRPIRWGIGYALADETDNKRGPLPFLRPGKKTAYWYGTGGSCAIADVERGITFAYTMNQCYSGRDQLNGSYYRAVYENL